MSSLKIPAWSHTALTSFETCGFRYYCTRVTKDVVDPPNEAALWGQRVHEALEARVKTHKPLPEGMEQWESMCQKWDSMRSKGKLLTETQMCLNRSLDPVSWFAKDAWVRGVVDVGVVTDRKAVVADYKTGKRKPDNDQLKLFALMAFHHYPNVEIVHTSFIWMKEGKTDREKFYREQIPELWNEFNPRIERFENAFKQNKWQKKPSGLCGKWCPVPKSKCEFSGKDG